MVIERIKKYFDIEELVCRHVYSRFGEKAWDFFDRRLLEVLLFVREGIGKPIYVNNWQIGGSLSQRGIRCNVCALVQEKSRLEKVYMSTHLQGNGIDFDVKGMTAEEVRRWIYANRVMLPHKVRLESDVTWVHLDTRNYSNEKVLYFKG